VKRKVRTITVNGQKFVWWYSICEHETTVHLSPLEDKTSVISVVFADIEDSLYGQYNERVVISWEVSYDLQYAMILWNESITMYMGGTECCVAIVAPKMAGLLLTYFTKQDYFKTRKSITLNGYNLLSQMGYRIVEVKKGFYW